MLLSAFALLLQPSALHAEGDYWFTEQAADMVVGQPDFTTKNSDDGPADLYRPQCIAIDPASGKVYIADTINNRVLRYGHYADFSTGESAEAVFGQDDFYLSAAGLDAGSMDSPHGVAIGPNGELWVADYENNRILRFDDAATKESGSDADGVLGQSDFVSKGAALTQDGMEGPRGMFCDSEGNLIVADLFNNRVLVYAEAHLKGDGDDADFVLGQPDFETADSDYDQATLYRPSGVFLTEDLSLYVADSGHNRILIYDEVTDLESGGNASRVLGQSDFDESGEDLSSDRFDYPANVWVSDTDKLFVCDDMNFRVLVFEDASTLNGLVDASAAIGAPDFDTKSTDDQTTNITTNWGLLIDPDNRLWVADFGNNRVLIFNEEYTKADLTLGERRNRQKGNDVYNTTGAGQKKRFRTAGKKVKVHCRIGNDGTFTDSFTCSGSGSNRKFRVKHFAYAPSKANVTAQVKTGTYSTGDIGASSYIRYRMDVKPKSSAGSSARIRTYLQGTSEVDGETDLVVGKVVLRN